LASIASSMSGPTVSRTRATRRRSSSMSAPTFSLINEKPSATALLASRTSLASS
jgi:hypothetical protein